MPSANAKRAYDEKTAFRVGLKLNRRTDGDLIAALEAADSKQGLIKDALRLYQKTGKGVTKMNSELRMHIQEICGSEFWKPITGINVQDETVWQIFSFEHDIEFDGSTWRCVILEKVFYDPDDLSAVDHADDILAEAWSL